MTKCVLYVVFFYLFSSIIGGKLPSTFHVCKRTEEKQFSACLKEAITNALPQLRDGMPSLGIGSLDPLYIESMTIGTGTHAFKVEQKFKNIKVYNLLDSSVNNVEAKLEEDRFKAVLYTSVPKCIIKSDYEFKGQVFLVPMHGSGNSTVELDDLHVIISMPGKIVEKKGNKYLELDDVTVDFNPSNIKFQFDNLFNGDEVLGREMNKLLNENSKEIFEDAKIPYEQALALFYAQIANTVFAKVTLDELFPKE